MVLIEITDIDLISTRTDQEFLERSVETLAERIRQNIDEYGQAIVGLSGGSTPKPIYEALGKEEIDWGKVTLFLVDERYVPADHKDSNQKMIRETLMKSALIPDARVVFPDTTRSINDCVDDYEQRLALVLAQGIPHIVTLGMGDDGHIASLFPPVGDAAFSDRLVIHTQTENFAVRDRISTTMVVIGSAERKIFFLKGAEKKKVWETMEHSFDITRWPAVAALNLGGGVVISRW